MAKTRFSVDLATKAQSLCAQLGRKTSPLNLDLFTELSKQDLLWLNQQLHIKTARPIEYWCDVFASFNLTVIERREVRKWRGVETKLISTGLPQKMIGKIALLFIYFRLNEIDNADSIPDRANRRKKAEHQIQRLKKQATALVEQYNAVEKSITGFLEDLCQFNQDPIGPLLDELRPLQRSNATRAKAIRALAKAVQELPDDAQPKLLLDIDKLFHPKAKDRAYEYSHEETRALLAIESLLQDANFSANKAASLMADIWNTLVPLRESWDFANRTQALRRLLKRKRQTMS